MGVSWVSPGWWDDIKYWTSGSVVDVTRMVGLHKGMNKWECHGYPQDGGMTPRNGQVGVSCLSPGWRDDIKEWTSGSVVGITMMVG